MADAVPELSIGEVAERTGLSVHALRFYEREGLLLTDIARGADRHRRYSQADVDWLGICVRLRSSGMPLAKIKRFADLVRQGPGNEAERLELLREHQQRVTEQVADLNECLEVISWKAGIYEEHLVRGTAAHLWAPGSAKTS